MTDWLALEPGDEVTVSDADRTAKVVRSDEHLYLIKRYFDNGWQNTVWVRKAGNTWRVARAAGLSGDAADDIDTAIAEGIIRSREALKGADTGNE